MCRIRRCVAAGRPQPMPLRLSCNPCMKRHADMPVPHSRLVENSIAPPNRGRFPAVVSNASHRSYYGQVTGKKNAFVALGQSRSEYDAAVALVARTAAVRYEAQAQQFASVQ
ncbi:unnamed protein product [Soboliphyme baturini]|uniref:AP2/ERF domain-containing protein n=1 Tax=Soboliphyme baturini TaxID=241478 RepID=A0A183IFE4_9BILA|nr:unnamed protein product [Soboliphyme baturini]